ncbi:efflux RND transporter permease subunit [Arsenicitalea aurantiaca]|uniref:Efflux RND transporter permease subunit n=1 Tax=Arsenicitalea aurantiaca TaxID=1783274 RepID=A0A433X3I1_9HYPH|nr:efflux RND transporter permease subunit [Arsenicitalea aurantiaca]RUT28625.1 efflux RND transporter permease subunit [Arsenicitalea aurantiaca]
MMNALEALLRLPKLVLTIMALMVVAGISAYLTLPKESQPAIDVPYLYVSVNQTGISPADADRLLVSPLETELQDLPGLVSMRSTSTTGHASVMLEFDINFNKDQALSDAKDRVDRAAPQLPADADDPTVSEINISEFGSVTVALYGALPDRALYRYADQLRDAIQALPTVLDVDVSGDREEVLEVIVDLLKLESYNLTTNELFDALARNNLVVPAGRLDTGQGRFAIEVPGLIESADDVFNLPIKTDGETVVTFSDVATIQRTFKDAEVYTRVNGEPAVVLAVNKRLGANIIDLSNAVRATTETLSADWPQALQTSYILDQAVFAQDMFTSLQNSVLTAIALVLIVTVALLGLRPALLIGSAIPITFMIGFLFLQLMGMTINMMIMFGLVLTVGMLVDGAIVVTEYAERKIAEGLDRRDAFIAAARAMFWPILASTATTLAAFMPLLLWPGIIGKFMSYLPIMVIVTLSASFIVAMVFLPVIGAFTARRKVSAEERAAATMISGGQDFDPRRLRGLMGVYVRILSGLVRHPLITLIAGFGLIGVIFFAYANNPTGIIAFPEIEPEYATVAVTGRGNYSPVQIRDLLIEVEEQVLQVEGIRDTVLNFGSTGAVASVPPDTIGNLQLELLPYRDRRKAEDIFAEIRERTAGIAGVTVQMVGAEAGPPAGKAINMRVVSRDYAELTPTVTRLRDYIENELGDTIDIEDTRPLPGIDWQIGIDREMAGRFGLGVRELSPYVQLVTSGVQIGTYRPTDATDELEIRVRLPREQRTFDALDSLNIITQNGLVPVSNFITRTPVPKVADIRRWDGEYFMSVAANVTGDATMGSVKVEELRAWLETQDWPNGVRFDFAGADEQTNETNAFMAQAGTGAIFLMFLILLAMFNSFYQVFITLSTVVMSIAGVLLGMMITGQPFSAIMTGIGIVSLAGIVVNNAIVLLDTYNQMHRKEGIEPVTAILMTAAQRIRPVIMTTTTTVFGLIPMAIGVGIDFFSRTVEIGGPSGAWWTYLATALVSGLIFSTLLTLVLVPVMVAAPHIWWRQIRAIAAFLAGLAGTIARALGGLGRAPQPATASIALPDMPDSASRYINADRTGLVETERNGVIVVSRQAAE